MSSKDSCRGVIPVRGKLIGVSRYFCGRAADLLDSCRPPMPVTGGLVDGDGKPRTTEKSIIAVMKASTCSAFPNHGLQY